MSDKSPAHSAHVALNRIFLRLNDIGEIEKFRNEFNLISNFICAHTMCDISHAAIAKAEGRS